MRVNSELSMDPSFDDGVTSSGQSQEVHGHAALALSAIGRLSLELSFCQIHTPTSIVSQ